MAKNCKNQLYAIINWVWSGLVKFNSVQSSPIHHSSHFIYFSGTWWMELCLLMYLNASRTFCCRLRSIRALMEVCKKLKTSLSPVKTTKSVVDLIPGFCNVAELILWDFGARTKWRSLKQSVYFLFDWELFMYHTIYSNHIFLLYNLNII